MWTTCYDDDIERRLDFEYDAPEPRYRGIRGRPEIEKQPHPLSRGALHDQDAIPDVYLHEHSIVTAPSISPRVYNLWRLSGNMYTRHTTGNHHDRQREFYTLFGAYAHGLSLGARAAPFRNAVIEAVTELLDDYDGPWQNTGWHVLRDATARHPECQLCKLVAFKFVVSVYEGMWTWLGPNTIGDEDMLALAKRTKAELPVGRKGWELWQEVVNEGARFHEPRHRESEDDQIAML
jgi:hypothetical protein